MKLWAYLCKIFYVFLLIANEMFQKMLRLFTTAVEVCGGKVGYCSSHIECNRVRVGVCNWIDKRGVREKGGDKIAVQCG